MLAPARCTVTVTQLVSRASLYDQETSFRFLLNTSMCYLVGVQEREREGLAACRRRPQGQAREAETEAEGKGRQLINLHVLLLVVVQGTKKSEIVTFWLDFLARQVLNN